MKPWLYRIATNVCLDELARRPKRALATDAFPHADPRAPIAPAFEDALWLEPMPDAWIDSAHGADPASRYTLKESVALAFYRAAAGEPLLLRAIQLLGARDGKIATIDHFMTPAVFSLFGVPARHPSDA